MKILQVPVLVCLRCKQPFAPRIDPVDESVIIPKACPKRDCRSQIWNIPDDELVILNQKRLQNLGHDQTLRKKVPILDKYKPKKSEKPLVVCLQCELFFYDEPSLTRHRHRRHHGMCKKCYSSNVFVVTIRGIPLCKTCATIQESQNLKNTVL
jgi:hypothetical protein